MKKIIAYVSAFMLIVVGMLSLASCKGNAFYSEWHKAGAEIEKTNIFKETTIDEIESMKKDSKSFAVFFGSSADTQAVSDMTAMQYAAELKNYEGSIYFVTTTKLKKNSKMQEIKNQIGVDLSDLRTKIDCVLFEKGTIEFNTSNPNGKYDDELKKFDLSYTEDSTSVNADIIAVLEYVIEFYPVKD